MNTVIVGKEINTAENDTENIGKALKVLASVRLTRKQAEAKIKEMENGENSEHKE